MIERFLIVDSSYGQRGAVVVQIHNYLLAQEIGWRDGKYRPCSVQIATHICFLVYEATE